MKTKILVWIIAVLVLSSSVFGALTDGLKYYYTYDNADLSGATVIDKSGQNNATQSNMDTGLAGKIGQAFYGNASDNNYVQPTTAVQLTTFTINFWINFSDNWGVPTEYVFISGNNPANDLFEFADYSNPKTVFFRAGGSGTQCQSNLLSTLGTGYTMLTFTRSGTNLSVYVNASYIGSCAVTANALDMKYWWWYSGTGTTDMIGYYDEVGVWNRTLNGELTTLFASGVGLSYPLSSPSAPIINNATYNLTSASSGQNSTAWRNGNGSVPIKTLDTTPTVNFNTTQDATCRIGKAEQNWTTMGNTRNCSTTGSTLHICTVIAGDAYVLGSGYNSLFIGCIESTLMINETPLSTSGALNLSLGFSPVIINLSLLPSPSYTDSLMNCSFRVINNDTALLNVTVNWTGGAYVQYFNNTANNTFLNSTWLHGTAKGTNLTCNVTVSDGEITSIGGNKSTVSNSVPYDFTVTSPLNKSTVFGTAVNFSWNCSDADAGDTLTSSWVLNGTPNGTDVLPGVHKLLNLSYDICYEMFGFCYDNDTAASNDITLYFCTNSTSVCDVVVSGLVDGSRYRSESVNIGLSCLTGLPASACTVSINSYAPESINCSLANLTLELGRNDVRFNVSGEEKRMIVYAKRLNESGFGAYFVIIILIAVLGFLMMAYNRWLRLGAVAVLIGLGGCVLGASVIAWSFWAGGFVIMCSVFFVLYEVFKG